MSKISVVMGSTSDWPTVKEGCAILDQFGVAYDKQVISAHRMPQEMFDFAKQAAATRDRGAGADQGPGRDGLPAFDRADAGRNSGGHDGDRGGRG